MDQTVCITKNCHQEFADWQTFFGVDPENPNNYFNCYLVYALLWGLHFSSAVMKQQKPWQDYRQTTPNAPSKVSHDSKRNLSRFRLNHTQQFFDVIKRLDLWSVVNKRETHFVDNFLKINWSFKIECLWLTRSHSFSISDRPTPNNWITQQNPSESLVNYVFITPLTLRKNQPYLKQKKDICH